MSFLKVSLLILGSFIVLICLWIIWIKLPVSINRQSDIKLGNSINKNIENYALVNKLPADTAWATFKTLGFENTDFSYKPEYQKVNDTTYELIFMEGFDGPCLFWNSNEKIWKEGWPTIVK